MPVGDCAAVHMVRTVRTVHTIDTNFLISTAWRMSDGVGVGVESRVAASYGDL